MGAAGVLPGIGGEGGFPGAGVTTLGDEVSGCCDGVRKDG